MGTDVSRRDFGKGLAAFLAAVVVGVPGGVSDLPLDLSDGFILDLWGAGDQLGGDIRGSDRGYSLNPDQLKQFLDTEDRGGPTTVTYDEEGRVAHYSIGPEDAVVYRRRQYRDPDDSGVVVLEIGELKEKPETF